MTNSTKSEMLDWLCERLAPLGPIRPKAMFGGFGIYCDGIFFAIVVDDQIYLKVDEVSRGEFEQACCAPFEYEAKGRRQSMSYFTPPDETIDDDGAFLLWARKALGAALRARAAEGKEKPRASKSPKRKPS